MNTEVANNKHGMMIVIQANSTRKTQSSRKAHDQSFWTLFLSFSLEWCYKFATFTQLQNLGRLYYFFPVPSFERIGTSSMALFAHDLSTKCKVEPSTTLFL